MNSRSQNINGKKGKTFKASSTKISFRSFGNEKTTEVRQLTKSKPTKDEKESKEYLTTRSTGYNSKVHITPEIRAKIAKILSVSPHDAFYVSSSVETEGLYLVNYDENANIDELGWIRGVLVDVNAMCIKAMSFGATPWITLDKITPDKSGDFSCIDEDGNNVTLNINDITIREGVEGCQVTALWHNSVMYLICRKNIYASKMKRPGWKITAGEAYEKLSGPTEFELFDTSKRHSPYSHTFIVAHPEFLISTKNHFGPGIISYGGYVQNWPLDDRCPYKQEDVDDELRCPVTELEMPDEITESFNYEGRKLSLQESNHFLRFGWLDEYEDSNDIRLRTGEFLFVYDEKNGKSYQISSSSYEWRKTIRGNAFTHKNNLYRLLDEATFVGKTTEDLQQEMNRFLKKYPLMCSLDMIALKHLIVDEDTPITFWPKGDFILDLTSRKDRQILIWQALLVSVPVQHQKEIFCLLGDYWNDQKRLIDWATENIKLNVEQRDQFIFYAQETLKVIDSVSVAHPGDLARTINKVVKSLPGERLYSIVQSFDNPNLVNVQKYRAIKARNKKLGLVTPNKVEVAPKAAALPLPAFS